MKSYHNLDNNIPWDTYWKVQLVCKKILAYSSWEPLLEYNRDQMPLTNQGYRNIMQLQISSRRENRLRDPESSRLEFSQKFLGNNFALSDRKSNLWVAE